MGAGIEKITLANHWNFRDRNSIGTFKKSLNEFCLVTKGSVDAVVREVTWEVTCPWSITNLFIFLTLQAREKNSGEMAAIKIIKLEPGDDFAVIQQEIVMMKDCKHSNIVAYFGSYLR